MSRISSKANESTIEAPGTTATAAPPEAEASATSSSHPKGKGSGSARTRLRPGGHASGLAQTVAAAAELLEEGDRAHAGIPTDARDLLVTEIEPDPMQPRRHFDEADLKALAEDIGRRGVLQPILVRPPTDAGGPYRLIAGERRWRAAQMAGKVRIPVRVRDLTDEDVRAAQLAENILRTGLTDIEKGRALRRLYELRKSQNYKTTWEDIAAEVGLGRARINDLFNLASLPEPVAALIESGRLSGSHGIALQRAQGTLGEEQIVTLADQAARPEGKRTGGFGLSVARLREYIQQRVEEISSESSIDALPAEAVERISVLSTGDPSRRSASPLPSMPLRPFIRSVLEAHQKGTLAEEERLMLLEALGKAPQNPPSNLEEGVRVGTTTPAIITSEERQQRGRILDNDESNRENPPVLPTRKRKNSVQRT